MYFQYTLIIIQWSSHHHLLHHNYHFFLVNYWFFCSPFYLFIISVVVIWLCFELSSDEFLSFHRSESSVLIWFQIIVHLLGMECEKVKFLLLKTLRYGRCSQVAQYLRVVHAYQSFSFRYVLYWNVVLETNTYLGAPILVHALNSEEEHENIISQRQNFHYQRWKTKADSTRAVDLSFSAEYGRQHNQMAW